jgi:HSP20 family molecular chaperone IbpA
MFPILHRTDRFFPDIDRMFEEMDEMMESSLSTTRFPRPSLSLLGKDTPEELILRRPLGFKVTQDEKEYKVAVHVPDVEAKDIDLQLDHDGRVLRLKGDRTHEEGGMKVQSRFEKAILLSPDVDTTKLAANMSGGIVTVVAPKIENKVALDKADDKKIEIKIEEPKAAVQESVVPTVDTEKVPTRLAVENLKDEKVTTSHTTGGDTKWPSRDFPY